MDDLELIEEERAFLRRWPVSATRAVGTPGLVMAIPIILKLQTRANRAEWKLEHRVQRDHDGERCISCGRFKDKYGRMNMCDPRHTWKSAQWIDAAQSELREVKG